MRWTVVALLTLLGPLPALADRALGTDKCYTAPAIPDSARFNYTAAGELQVDGLCVDTRSTNEFSVAYTVGCMGNENQVFHVDAAKHRIALQPWRIYCLGVLEGAVVLARCDGASSTSNFNIALDLAIADDQQLQVIGTDLCVQVYSGAQKSCSDDELKDLDYCNVNLDPKTRAKDLVQRLTFIEKLSNLISSGSGVPRLGVPVFQFNEALHGIVSGCGAVTGGNTGCPTSFPHALMLSASFNSTLWHTVSRAIALEGRSLNNQGLVGMAFWAPDINLFRDPRWGRGQEVPGEDPFLAGEYAIAYIRGFQFGDDSHYLQSIATAKHFVDYDIEGNWGIHRDWFDAIVSKKDQVEYYLPQWRAAIQGANVQSMMCSYNSVNGVPACGNSFFMKKIARELWGFDGFIVSDCGAINDPAYYLYVITHLNFSYDQSIKLGMQAGCDLNCGSDYLGRGVKSYVHRVLSEEIVDEASTRVYTGLIRLGFLDPPAAVSYRSLGPEIVDSAEHRALALDAAKQGIVLLKNEGILPLSKTAKVAVIGPHANATDDMISIYHGDVPLAQSHSPLQALRNMGIDIIGYEAGCPLDTVDITGSDIKVAAKLASTADAAIVFVGLHPGQGFTAAREDEGYDRNYISFPGSQEQLIRSVLAANPNTVVVLINGGPISSSWMKSNVPAIVEAWYPGELGGDAIASILFGDSSPSGRLPVTIYDEFFVFERSIGDMSLTAGNGITYRHYHKEPLWPFGFGLSYTTFSYELVDAVKVASTVDLAAAVESYYAEGGTVYGSFVSPLYFKVMVTNTGSFCSGTSVLGFLSSDHPGAPLSELFAYSRLELCPGESGFVVLQIPPQVIALVDDSGTQALHEGTYNVKIADGAITDSVTLSGEIQVLFTFPEED